MSCSVFLTGATGYVGRHVLSELARRGHRVTCLARSAETALRLERDGHTAVVGDLSASSVWAAAAVKCDAVIHTAFPYDDAGEELADVEAAFVRELLRNLESQQRPPQFVYTSSLFLFGAKRSCTPFSEFDAPALDPAAWRLRLERDVLERDQNRRHTIVRLGWVYGGDGGTLKQAVADASLDSVEVSELRVPLIHVRDVAELYVRAIEQPIDGLLHACERSPLSWREIIRVVQPDGRPQPAAGGVSEFFDYDRPAQSLRSMSLGWTPLRRFASDYRPSLPDEANG